MNSDFCKRHFKRREKGERKKRGREREREREGGRMKKKERKKDRLYRGLTIITLSYTVQYLLFAAFSKLFL